MADFVATSVVSIHESVEEAVTALDTAIDAVVNTSVIRTSTVLRIEANRYASILVHTAAV